MHSSDFSALYESSYSAVYQTVCSIEKSSQTAEDTVQEIYLAAWSHFRHQPHPNPFGWLIITARHKAYDMVRKRLWEARHFIPLNPDSDNLVPDTGPDSFGLYPRFEDEPLYGRIRPLLRDDEFDLILSHYDQGIPINELSRKLQISSSACYMRLHRARRKLEVLLPSETAS